MPKLEHFSSHAFDRAQSREIAFSHSKYFDTPKILNLPRDGLHRPRRPVENQLSSLGCGAYAAAAVGNAYIRRVRFRSDWQAISISKKQSRRVDINGSEPRACLNSLRDDGSIVWDAAMPHLATHGTAGTDDAFDCPATATDQAQNNRITADRAPDELACAETCNEIYKQAFGEYFYTVNML